VNAALVRASDTGLAPIIGLPPLVGLLVVSIVTAVLMLLVMARVSDQKGLAEAKRGIHAALFEIRLYNDDLVAVMRALGDALRHNGRYLLLSLVPLVWMAIPLVLVVAQLQAFYGYAGLTPGQPAIVKVELRGALPDASAGAVVLAAPTEVRVETGAVRLASANEVLWRIVPTVAGEYTLTVRVGSTVASKTLQVSSVMARRSPRRVSAGLIGQLLYPSESPLPAGGLIAAINVAYPEPGIDLAGWRVHWMVVYIGLSMACAFALAGRFGVTL